MSETEVRKQEETIMRKRQHLMMLIAPTYRKYQPGGTFYRMTLDNQGKKAADIQAQEWVKRFTKAAQEAKCDADGNPI